MATLNRRTVLQAGVALAAAGAIMESGRPSAVTKTYYVSGAGSDANPGTEAAPWASLARIRAALDTGVLRRGDTVLLKRGETFYGSIQIPSVRGITGFLDFGAYGTGERPTINGYKISKAA